MLFLINGKSDFCELLNPAVDVDIEFDDIDVNVHVDTRTSESDIFQRYFTILEVQKAVF